jgi:glycosyltransferase involved in cell wall biosynthesis
MRSLGNILLTNSTDVYGGGEFFVYQLAVALRDRGAGVTVSCKPSNLLREKCEKAGIHVEPLDFPAAGRLIHFIGRLKNIITANDIRLVHSNTNYDRTAAAFAAQWAGVHHVTNVHSFHSIQYNLTHWYRNRFATDHFIVDGACVRDLLVKEDQIRPERISVVHLGMNPEEMKRDHSARARVRKEFDIADDTVVIGNVGRLVPMKGQEYLLRAFAPLVRRFPKSVLLLVGDGELMETLKATAHGLGIEPQMLFAGFRDDLGALYSAFDIYAHSSVEGGGETFPFAVLQALAEELPVVATRVGDVAEMVVDGETGFVVPDREVTPLEKALSVIVDDPARRRQMAEGSRKLFLSRFTLAKMVDEIVTIYGQVLTR